MGELRWRVVTLLLWLTFFFNIERLDIDIDNIDTINLPTSVYIIGILIAIAALFSFFQRRSVWLLVGTGVGFYILALVVMRKPVISDVHLYLTLAGILMLTITAFLAYNLGRSLEEFIVAVGEMTFSNKGGRLRSANEAHEFVDSEMSSSRRFQRPLSLVLLQGDASSMNMAMHRLIQDIQRSMMQRYLMATLARVLSRYLRRTDIIIEGEQPGRLVLVAPETTTAQAQVLGSRLQQLAQEQLGMSAHFSVATFPDQALTYEDLLNVAEQRLNERPDESAAALDASLTNRSEPTIQDALNASPKPTDVEVGHAHGG